MIQISDITIFFDEIQEYYNKKYSDSQMIRLKDYLLNDRHVSDKAWSALYDAITKDSTYLPRVKDFEKIFDNGDMPTSSLGLHPQSPVQMILKFKHKPVEWIIAAVYYLRDQQLKRELNSWEISFLVCWGELKSVQPEFRESAKQDIIAYRQVDYPTTVHEKQEFFDADRQNISRHISEVMSDLMGE